MLEQIPELAPDLEWMLQSKGIEDQVLLERLVEDYVSLMQDFAGALIGDPDLVLAVTVDTLALIVQDRYRFWGNDTLQVWVLGHMFTILQRRRDDFRWQHTRKNLLSRKFKTGRGLQADQVVNREAEFWHIYEQLDLTSRALLFLSLQINLTKHEIARVVKRSEHWVARKFVALRKTIPMSGLFPEMPSQEGETGSGDVPLKTLWGRMSFRQPEDFDWIAVVENRQSSNLKANKMKSAAGQISLAFGLLVLVALISWVTNRGASQQSPNPMVASTVIVTKIVEVPVYITPTPIPPSTPEPLLEGSTRNEIEARMQSGESMWQELWLQAIIIDYGPAGYTGQPNIRREEMWISQPYNSLVLSGPIEAAVDRIWFSLDGKVYQVNPENGNPTLYDFHPRSLPVYSALEPMIFPAEYLSSQERVVIVGMGTLAQRPVVLLDVYSEFGRRIRRLWLDQHTGTCLMERSFASNGETVLRDITVTRIAYDPEIPEDVFNRKTLPLEFTLDGQGSSWLGGLSPNQPVPGHGTRERTLPPIHFDPTDQLLSFEWNEPIFRAIEVNPEGSRIPADPESSEEIEPLALFAREYYLGSPIVGNIWNVKCERSVQGGLLAFLEQPEAGPNPNTRLRWLALEEPEIVYEVLEPQAVIGDDIAFSPDGSQLVFWACEEDVESCGVILLDLEERTTRLLYQTGYVSGFVWDSNGNDLAMLTANDYLVVVNLPTGQITYRGPVDSRKYSLPDDDHHRSGFNAYRYGHTGLSTCSRPAGKAGALRLTDF